MTDAPAGAGPPRDPKEGRQRRLVRFLQAAAIAVLVLAVLSLVLPGDAGRLAADAMVAVVIATPVARVAWLLARWVRRRDLRFAYAAAALLFVVGAGAAFALLSA